MKKLLISFLTMFMLVTPTLAAENIFYKNSSGQWDVFGHGGNKELNPACVMQTIWNDGSKLLVIQDLADGELYIHFMHKKWNVKGPYNTNYELVLDFYTGNRIFRSISATFKLLNDNSIHIRGIKHDMFLNPFMDADRVAFIMPGDVPNITVGLRGTTNAVDYLKECMRASTKENLSGPKKGQDI